MSARENEDLKGEVSSLRVVRTEEFHGAQKTYMLIPSGMISSALNMACESEKVQSSKKKCSPVPLLGGKVCVTLHKQHHWMSLSVIGNEMLVTGIGR